MNLYEIDEEIMKCVDEETGEIVDAEKFDQLNMNREQKIENIACWIKNLKSDAEQLKEEADKLTQRKKAAENKAESLQTYLQKYLAGEKYKSAKVSVSYRKTTSVNITDIASIPEEYLKHQEPVPDKAGIKAAIKGGTVVPGVKIEEGASMIIK